MEPVLCPLCTRSDLEQIFLDVTITAKMDGQNTAGGLLAYRCTEHDHIFLVRRSDVEVT